MMTTEKTMNERIKQYVKDHLLKERYGPYGDSTLEEYYEFYPEELNGLIDLVVKETIDEMITNMWHNGIDESNNPSFYKAIDKTKEIMFAR
jgi:hypothetical protein